MTAEAAPTLATASLGKTGHAVTRLGLGAAHIVGGQGGDLSDDAAIATVHRALDVGITYLDTAPLYGESERCIGLALRDHPRASELFIATKIGLLPGHLPDYSYAGVMRNIETSLERFGQPMLHLAQIHEIQDEQLGAGMESRRCRRSPAEGQRTASHRPHRHHRLGPTRRRSRYRDGRVRDRADLADFPPPGPDHRLSYAPARRRT